MLELRPNCECCDKDLPPESAEARICTFECTREAMRLTYRSTTIIPRDCASKKPAATFQKLRAVTSSSSDSP